MSFISSKKHLSYLWGDQWNFGRDWGGPSVANEKHTGGYAD